MNCANCESGTGSEILITEDLESGEWICSDTLNACDFDRCNCQLDFVSGLQNVSNWTQDVSNQEHQDVADCENLNLTSGTESAGGSSGTSGTGSSGTTESSGSASVDVCARRRKRHIERFGF